MLSLSLPPSLPPSPPESKKAKTRHFPILGLKRGVTGVRVNFQYSFVQYWRQPQGCLHCNVNDQTWTEALTGIGKKCLFKNRHSGMQCQESTWSSFPSSIFTPHIEAGNRSTWTQSQGVRLFLQGKSTQRCLTMIKYTTLTTALWRLLLHTCHFLDYLLNNNSRRKNSIWWNANDLYVVVDSFTCLLLHALGLVSLNLITGIKWKLHFSLFPPQN